jgi:hypothetical protein
MTVTEDIVAYVNQRYMNSPNLLNATLSDIREKKIPRNHQQAADNIASTITMGRLLDNVGILVNVELTQIAMLEARCILGGTRRELYNQKQIENLMMEDEPLRASTPILNGSLRNDPVPAVLDGSMALAQLSLSMAKVQAGGDAEKSRDFFFKYLHKESAALLSRYAIRKSRRITQNVWDRRKYISKRWIL